MRPTIAVLDTGIAQVPGLKSNLVATADFVNKKAHFYDDNAHGTHVAGVCVSVNPGVGLIAVKVLDGEGRGNSADSLAGVQWVIDNCVKYNIRVANLSIGAMDSGSRDPLVRAVEAAWDAGVVMIIAAGNGGPHASSVTSPGTSRKVITVGAYDDANCTDAFGTSLINFSGRGPTSECIVKPDILASGCGIVSLLSNSPEMSPTRLARLDKAGDGYVRMSGTSMAAPFVSGAISLLLTKNPQLTPDEVKLALKLSAKDLGLAPNRQGWGMLDTDRLLRG